MTPKSKLGYLFCENISFFYKIYRRLDKLMLDLRITAFLDSNKKKLLMYHRKAVFKECAKLGLAISVDLSNSIIAIFLNLAPNTYITDQISATSQP